MYINIYIHMHTYIHMFIHTYIHTYIQTYLEYPELHIGCIYILYIYDIGAINHLLQ